MTDEMQKARELALAVLLVGNAPPFEYYKGDTRWDVAMAKCKAENEATLDRVIVAVRAETLREVRGVIADVKAGGEDFADNADEKFGWDQACDCVHNSLALKDTLDALAQPEGTPVVSDPFIAGEEARLRKRHEDSGTNRPYYSGD